MLFKKIFSSLLSIVTTSTLAMTPIIANNLETNISLYQIKENLSNDKQTLYTQQQNINLLQILSNKKYDFASFRKIANEIVTDEQVEQFKTDILNKIAASIYTLGNLKSWTSEQTKEIVLEKCGIFLKNFQNQKEGLNLNETEQDQINIGLYKYLQSEEEAINIDVFDSYNAQLTVDSIKDSFYESLKKINNHNLSDGYKKSLSAKFSSVFDNYVDYAKSSYFSQLEFDIGLLNLQGNYNFFQNFVQPLNQGKNNCTYQNFSKSIAEQQLRLVMSNFINYYRNSIQLNNEGRSFLSCIADYSNNGYLSAANLDNNLIKTEDLSKLFTYEYDSLQGIRLLKPNFDYNILATNIGELKDDIDIKEILPIQDFKTIGGSEYQNGELYPGYLAHFRVVNLIDNQDDSECDISLEIGVSDSIRDPSSEHILWLSDYNKERDADNNDAEPEYQTFCLTVDGIAEKRYIAKNTFYKGLSVELCSNEYDKDTDEYYESTASERPYLDEILDAKALINKDGSYNISSDSPIFLYGDDVKGIPTPELPSSFSQQSNCGDYSLTSLVAYKHQFLRFMIVDYNTNITDKHKLALCGHWVIMSDSPSKFDDTNETKTFEQVSVYDIPWDNDIENIWVSYQIDEHFLKTMSDVLGYSSLVNDYINDVEPNILALDEKKNSRANSKKTPLEAAEQQRDINIATTFFDCLLVVLLGASLGFCLSIMTIFWQKFVVGVAYGIAITIEIAMSIAEGMWAGFFNSSLLKTENKILPTVKSIKSDVHEYSDDIILNYNKLSQPRLNFNEKRQAISKIYEDIGISSDGSKVLNQQKLDKANDWFEKLKSLMYDQIDENLKTFYKNKFVFAKGSSEDFEIAKISYYAMGATAIGGTVMTIIGIFQSFVSIWNIVTYSKAFCSTAITPIYTISRIIIETKNAFRVCIKNIMWSAERAFKPGEIAIAENAAKSDLACSPIGPTTLIVISVASGLVSLANLALIFVENYCC